MSDISPSPPAIEEPAAPEAPAEPALVVAEPEIPPAEPAPPPRLPGPWRRFLDAQARRPEDRRYTLREVAAAFLDFWRRPDSWYFSLVWLLCALIFVAVAAKYWVSIIDDAFITFRFADNLIHGEGLRFNPGGMKVEGFTNFTWMVMIAGALAAGMDAMFAAKLLGMACALTTMGITWRFAAALRGRDDLFNLFPSLFLAANAHFGFWSVQGLETHLQVVLVLGAYHLFHLEMNDRRRWLISPYLATLAAMTRIDSLYYLSPLGVWGLWQVARLVIPLRRMILWGAIAAMTFGGYFAWKIWYFGDVMPNTYYAKVGKDYINVERGHAHLYEFYFNEAGWTESEQGPMPLKMIPKDMPNREQVRSARVRWLLAGGRFNSLGWINLWMGGLLLCIAVWRARVAVLILAPIAMQAYYVHHVGGDWMPGFRFFQIVLPFLALTTPLAIGLWQEVTGRRWWATLPAGLFFGAAMFVTVFEQFEIETVYVFSRDPMWIERREEWRTPVDIEANMSKSFSPPLGPVSDYLLLNTIEGAWILMDDIGQPMWFSTHLKLIDVAGLTDKYMADAPSVRGETFGGPPIRPRADILREMLEARGAGAAPTPDEEAGLRQEANRRYLEQIEDRNTRYIMEHIKPEYILAFGQHNGSGPTRPGHMYPDPVRRAMAHQDFVNYEEDWYGVKTGGDIWNHLYRRKDVPKSIPREQRIARLERTIARNPRLGYLIPLLCEELRAVGTPESKERIRELLNHAIERFASDEGVLHEIVEFAQRAEDPEIAQYAVNLALQRNPRQSGLYQLLCTIHERKGDWKKAAEALEMGLPYAAPMDNSLHYRLSYIYEQQLHDIEGALRVAREATRRHSGDIRAWSDYATIAERADRVEEAIDGFEHLYMLRGNREPLIQKTIERLRERQKFKQELEKRNKPPEEPETGPLTRRRR